MSGITFYFEEDSIPAQDKTGPEPSTMPPGNPGFVTMPGRDSMDPSSAKVIPDQMGETLQNQLTYQASTKRVLARYLQECDPRSHSGAWISPKGEVFLLPGGATHDDAAQEYLGGDKELEAHNAGILLVDRGWIRVANFSNMEIRNQGVSREAGEAAAEMVVRCALSNPHSSPDDDFYLDKGSRSQKMTLGEFVARFGYPSLEEDLYEGLRSQRHGSKKASAACNPNGFSYAWVDPYGKVHQTRQGPESWAMEFVSGIPDLREQVRDTYGEVLLKEGWVRIANFTGMAVWKESTPSRKAWETVTQIVRDCVLQHRDIDPFEPLVFVEQESAGGRAEVYSVADFMEKFADPRASDQLFESLMSRTAAKLDDILRQTSPSILEKAPGVQLKRKQLNAKTGFWLYEASGSKGEKYKVRVKATKKGNVNRPSKLDFKVSCTCPFWRWQGPEHWAKANDYLYGKPVGTAAKPTVKDPDGGNWCCKHAAAVLGLLLKGDAIMGWGKWGSSERPAPSRVASAYVRSKTACIISVGEWGGKKCLFKNRDRNYTPEVRIYHKLVEGVEVLYMKDELTGWCEGMNEYGIGLVNAALAVRADEKAGKAGKGKSDDPSTQSTLKDGKRALKALSGKTLEEALEKVQSHLGGLRGHTFLASPDQTWALEATWRGHDFHQRKLSQSKKHVRTNHGQFYPDAGYTEKDGENYLSSLARRDQAMKILRKIESPGEIAPSIFGRRRKDREDPLNMVKMTEGMRTNTQVVMNLTDREMLFYLLPGQVEFLGYQNDLPKGHKPKLSLKVLEYTDLDEDGDFEVEEVSPKTKKKSAGVL
jgi:hypothetical protein